MRKYIIGNWKANKTVKEAKDWITQTKNQNLKTSDSLTVVLCPSHLHILLFKKEYPSLTLGCQNLSPYGDGAYTGQTTARMLADFVKYAILGHSERRRYFQESSQQVANKATQALDFKITPIIAVDSQNWRRQVNVLGSKATQQSILMYEPPEAISQQIGPIGKGEAAPLEKVKETISLIKSETKAQAVIYGGSVKSHNIQEFIKQPEIDGVLPGSASLNPQEWIKMLRQASQVV